MAVQSLQALSEGFFFAYREVFFWKGAKLAPGPNFALSPPLFGQALTRPTGGILTPGLGLVRLFNHTGKGAEKTLFIDFCPHAFDELNQTS